MKRYLLMGCASLCFALGCIGIFVPVLPTTPFILLSTFLFAKSSPRMHAWIQSTKVFRLYVTPFKEAGGLTRGMKFRILAISFSVMGLSAFFVQRWYVWVILGCVAVFLLYLMLIRIPTVTPEEVTVFRNQQQEAE